MVSGGADSACAAAGLAGRARAPRRVHASHVNYGLRAGADEGEAAARRLCAALRIDLHVERPQRLPDGNLQAAARTRSLRRRRAPARPHRRRGDRHRPHPHRRRRDRALPARRLARLAGAARPAAAHRPRRPAAARARARAGARARDRRRPAVRRRRDQRRPDLSPATGSAPRCCRCCATSTPAPSRTSPRPAPSSPRRRRCSSASCSRRSPTRAPAPARSRSPPRRSPTGSRACAGSPCARSPSAPPGATCRWVAPAPRRSSGSRRSPRAGRSSSGPAWSRLRVGARSASAPPPSTPRRCPRRSPLALPGPRAAWATGRCAPSFTPGRSSRPAPTSRRSTPRRSPATIEVRTWRDGDRIRPLGMAGTKTLQDLFTDRGVPRSLRADLPVVTVDGEVAWVAGVAVSERFRLHPRAERVAGTRPLERSARATRTLCASGETTRTSARSWSRPRSCSARVAELGAEINRDYAGRDLVMIGVLKGAVLFLADLMRELEVPCEVDFMAVSSYGSATDSSGVVRILKDLDASIAGRDVLLVEDIVDSGLTLHYLLKNLRRPRAALARGLRAAHQARAPARRSADPVRRLRDPEPLRDRLRARPRPALPQPALCGCVAGLEGSKNRLITPGTLI